MLFTLVKLTNRSNDLRLVARRKSKNCKLDSPKPFRPIEICKIWGLGETFEVFVIKSLASKKNCLESTLGMFFGMCLFRPTYCVKYTFPAMFLINGIFCQPKLLPLPPMGGVLENAPSVPHRNFSTPTRRIYIKPQKSL